MTHRKYEVWHDENREGGYHHGILLVPIDKKEDLIIYLKNIRIEHRYPHIADLKFAGSLSQQKKGILISNMLALFSHIIKTKDDGLTKIYNPTGKNRFKKEYTHFTEVSGLFGCRFGFLKIEDNFQSLQFDTYEKKVETTLRFVLKGCCHSMFNTENPIEIVGFYFDGNEHHGGSINLARILSGEFRPYCRISDNITVDARHVRDRHDDTKLVINFVDNIVGAWRSLLSGEIDEKDILNPLRPICERAKMKKIFSNPNGRWHKSIYLSELKIEDGIIEFPDIFLSSAQQSLF